MTPLLTKTLAGAMIAVDAKVSQLCYTARPNLYNHHELLHVKAAVSALPNHPVGPCPHTIVLHAILPELSFPV